MKEQAKILRVFKLIAYLKSHRRKAQELATVFEIDKRTIYRYFHLLEDIGFIVEKDMNDRYFIATYDEENEGVQFRSEEAELMKQILDTGAPKHPLKAGILKKLYINSELKPLSEDVINARNSQLIRKLHLAMEHENRVMLKSYHSASSNTIKDRLVEPINLSEDYNTLFAFDPEDRETKNFKVDRIGDVLELDKPITHSSQFKQLQRDIFGMTGSGRFTVKLKLSLRAQLLLREEHPQSVSHIKSANDSKNEYWFEAVVHDYKGVGRFVLGLIDQVEVLGDDGFREHLNGLLGIQRF